MFIGILIDTKDSFVLYNTSTVPFIHYHNVYEASVLNMGSYPNGACGKFSNYLKLKSYRILV